MKCLCVFIPKVPVRALGVELSGLRCPACIDAITESKNELVRSEAEAWAEVRRLQTIIDGLVERMAAQSDLLSRRAERPDA